jgi:hypothetical protein
MDPGVERLSVPGENQQSQLHMRVGASWVLCRCFLGAAAFFTGWLGPTVTNLFMLSEESTEVVKRAEDPGPQNGDPDVHKVIRAAELELHRLLQQKSEIAKRIRTIRLTVSGLAALFGKEILNEELSQALESKDRPRKSGITEACRAILLEAARPMTANDVCESLRREHPQLLERHKSPLANISTILNRLAQGGKIRLVQKSRPKAWESVI